jgi:hypothetical protein
LAELPAQVVGDPRWDVSVVVAEPTQVPQYAELDRESVTIGVASTAKRLDPVCWRKVPVTGELLVARVFRKFWDSHDRRLGRSPSVRFLE